MPISICLSISAISDLLGFNNQHYFSRVFKQYYSMERLAVMLVYIGNPPGEYIRKQNLIIHIYGNFE
ncbi:MAG: hypothetical protein B6241_08250 [Spirochaetaceae bacterium 4572_59]|nr:MAG: hypothetical protein B6241_08250 [Spirochaetaceae bacterium 4572_59]